MEEDCLMPQTNIFFDNVAPRFDSFKKEIKKLAKKNGIEFDEDVFMDTILKCGTSFSNLNNTNEDINLYFWKAYKQNSYSNFTRNKFKSTVDIDNIGDNIIDECYNNYEIDEIVNLIKTEVKEKFGNNIYKAWILHVCEGLSYKELQNNGFENLNLHNDFRQIKRYILNNIVAKNNKIKILLNERYIL